MSIELNETNYDEIVSNTEGISVVQFTATWCGPCRMLSPRLENWTEANGVTYYKVDVDENPALARGFQIMSIPTLRFYKAGTSFRTLVGMQRDQQLDQAIADFV